MLLPHSREWSEMADAIAQYQVSGGVVVISESNNRFAGRSGVLNALPSLSEAVDPGRWLSVVYVRREGESFVAGLNGCGREAAAFCVAVEAPNVLGAIPEGGWRGESGHSMATPMVSGLIAVILERERREDRSFSVEDALCVIRRSVRRDFAGYAADIHGLGLLDAKAALADRRGGRHAGC